MNNYPFGSSNSPKSFTAYPRVNEFDLESGGNSIINRRSTKKLKKSTSTTTTNKPLKMLKSFGNKLKYYYKLHPLLVFTISLSLGLTILITISLYERRFRKYDVLSSIGVDNVVDDVYPFAKLTNLVMVAGHSIYTSSSCGNVDKEDSWFLEPYQKNAGQAATFLSHIEKGIEITAHDDGALLLFSGGETRKEAGPRSEAHSYWAVAESKRWFGKQDSVRWRAMTEEHARDSFENLLFSVCRFRELTGKYPQNLTVVSYDFKEIRFANLHRSAIGFPESRFFYLGTPATPSATEGALKGEALVRSQFLEDPYGCRSSLWRKKLKRDPFHRAIPYPTGCPEIQGLFTYCGTTIYPGSLPWA
ncbi:hypothetical protein ACFE04_025619 [Oxalis oulophora]